MWDKILQIENELDIVNVQIKNNFEALKAIENLKKHHLKENKLLYKNEQNITKQKCFSQKKEIIENAKIAKNAIIKELTYNTSFIVSKYDELSELKQHKKIREINKNQKSELKSINKEIRNEKKKVSNQISKINLKTKKQIEDKYQNRIQTIEDKLLKSRKSNKFIVISTTIAISIPSLLLFALLINYLIFFPKMNGHMFDFSNINEIIAFTISMIMIVMILIVMIFIIKKSVKRIVIDREQKTAKLVSIGFMASFFDILGVGCFATSLGILKATKTFDDDKMIPGTLNMSFTIPILMEGSLLVSAVDVDIVTLIILVSCAVVGSYIGASIVNVINTKIVKLAISIALFIAAIVMILTTNQVGVITSGLATGLSGIKLIIGIFGFLLIGVLMSFGVGSYAPSMAILGLLGMSAVAIAPIMMCSSAFLMPLTSYKFYKDNNYLPKTSLFLMLGGVFGATIAFLFFYVGLQAGMGMNPNGNGFQSLVKWLTIGVMFYSSITLFIEFLSLKKQVNFNDKNSNLKRKPLNLVQSKKELTFEIEHQIQQTINEINTGDFDTKEIVELENIPIETWVSGSDDLSEKTNDK